VLLLQRKKTVTKIVCYFIVSCSNNHSCNSAEDLVGHVCKAHPESVRFTSYIPNDDIQVRMMKQCIGESISMSFTRTSDSRVTSTALIYPAAQILPFLSYMIYPAPGLDFSFRKTIIFTITAYYLLSRLVHDVKTLIKADAIVAASTRYPFKLVLRFISCEDTYLVKIHCRFTVTKSMCCFIMSALF